MRAPALLPACRWSIAALLVAGLSACQRASPREAPQSQPPDVAKAVTSASAPPSRDDLVDVFDDAKGVWNKVRARDVPHNIYFVHAGKVLQWRGESGILSWETELTPADLTKPRNESSDDDDDDEKAWGPDGVARRWGDNHVDFDLSAGKGEHKIWLRLPRSQQVNVLASDLSHPEWAITTVAKLKSGDRVQMSGGEIGLVTGNETATDQAVPLGEALVIGRSERLTDTLLEVRTTGSLVTTTPNHPFKVQGKGWVEAQKLQPGDALYGGPEGKRVEVVSATLRKVNPLQRVYNLETWPSHVFLVGAEGLAVHNGQCIPKPSPAPGGGAKRGIYEFPDQAAGGTPYVGQSGNIARRLNEHQRAGRLTPGTETTRAVVGGKTAREIAEHQRIQEITGGVPARQSQEVSNMVDPIGPNRQHLLEDK